MKHKAALLAILLVTTTCSREQWHRAPSPDDLMDFIPWFSTMRYAFAPQPYADPRAPVPGTVPITGAEADLRLEEEADLPAINRLRNPVARTAESLDRGKEVYQIFCFPCHGPAGAGDGPVSPRFVQPPDLTAAQARGYSDGYLYTLIRRGRGIMPTYGDKVRINDRWHVVNYLRQLQEGATQ